MLKSILIKNLRKENVFMAVSFHGAKKYKRRSKLGANPILKECVASPVHVFALKQNNGVKLTPLVKAGDRVLCSQKIADLDIFEALPLYSSVSGNVISVTDSFVTVENDALFEEKPSESAPKNPDDLTMREMLWIMRENAICEARVSTPLHVLLTDGKTPESLIVCCFDSDPYVSSPQFAARVGAEDILKALYVSMRVLGVKKAVIAVENDTMKTYRAFKYLLRYNTDITLACLKARYPQSRSDKLARALTGRADANVLVLSSETLLNTAAAFAGAPPVTRKIVTVSGDDILPSENFNVRIGASISSVLESAGYTDPAAVFIGGVVEGERAADLSAPVTPSASAITAFNDIKNIPKYRKGLI